MKKSEVKEVASEVAKYIQKRGRRDWITTSAIQNRFDLDKKSTNQVISALTSEGVVADGGEGSLYIPYTLG